MHSPRTLAFVLVGATLALLASAGTAAAGKSNQTPTDISVPNAGFSLLGDGNRLSADATSTYRNYAFGGASAEADIFGVTFSPFWSQGRFLRLTIRDPYTGQPITDAAGTPALDYRCDAATSTASGPYLAVSDTDAALQCYTTTKLGFYVDWAPFGAGEGRRDCRYRVMSGPASGIASTDNPDSGCAMAQVKRRNGGTFKLITEYGSKTPKCFMISFRVVASPGTP